MTVETSGLLSAEGRRWRMQRRAIAPLFARRSVMGFAGTVAAEADLPEVARLMTDFNLIAIPVLDGAGKPVGIIAVGGTLVFIAGGFDLSVGAISGFAGIIAAQAFNASLGLWGSLILGALGLLAGAFALVGRTGERELA